MNDKIKITIRKALASDIDAVAAIYDRIHTWEEKGNWKHPAEPTGVMVLHTLVIDPEVKGRGLGRRFVRFYEDYARQEGCKYLRLDTNSRNTSARALYKSMGYEEIGCVPCVFNGLEDVNLVLIEKAL